MIMPVCGERMDDLKRRLPAGPGSYLLALSLASPQRLAVGALGTFDFPAGLYLYCGSALGPGGIRARAGRHLEGRGAVRWHIDFLLRRARLREIWAREDTLRLECLWANALAVSGLCEPAAPGFGASDCRCRAHLWRLRRGWRTSNAMPGSLPLPPHRILVLAASGSARP